MSDELRERALDLQHVTDVADHLRDLAQTGLQETWLTEFLVDAATEPPLHWQVGEAFVEAVLEADHGIEFPWNTRRDERVPRASLPGADIVGLARVAGGGAVLVFGEVKSSSDAQCPPGVVVGKSGMVQQLERILTEPRIQFSLIQWLQARATTGDVADRFDDALARFVESQGAGIKLVGGLVRDTAPNEADVSARGMELGGLVRAPGSVELLVWYLPLEMDRWPELVAA